MQLKRLWVRVNCSGQRSQCIRSQACSPHCTTRSRSLTRWLMIRLICALEAQFHYVMQVWRTLCITWYVYNFICCTWSIWGWCVSITTCKLAIQFMTWMPCQDWHHTPIQGWWEWWATHRVVSSCNPGVQQAELEEAWGPTQCLEASCGERA